MSNPPEQPWSNSPNAPKIPYSLYAKEKADFAGTLAASILYGGHKTFHYTFNHAHFTGSIPGALIVLFFQCMVALFNPVNRKWEGIKWGFVSYTVAMFSFVTALNGMALHVKSLSYIDNRDYAGVKGMNPPGPTGYPSSIWFGALSIAPRLIFLLNNWLADGLLVSSSSDAAPIRPSVQYLTPTSPPDLSLLHNLLRKPLGDCLPLPHVPCLFQWAFQFPSDARG